MAAKRVFLVAASFFASGGATPEDNSINVSISKLPSIDVGLLHHKDDDAQGASVQKGKQQLEGASVKKGKQDPYGDEGYGDGMDGGVDAGHQHSESQAERAIEKAIASVSGGGSSQKFLSNDKGSDSPSNVSDAGESNAEAAKDLSVAGSMEAAITELMMGKSAFSATPMGGSVKTIHNLIAKTMIPKVKAAHSADQRLLERLVREIKKCGSTKNNAFKGAKTQFLKYKKNEPVAQKVPCG